MIWFLITWIISGLIVDIFLIKDAFDYGVITVKDVFIFMLVFLLGCVSLLILLITSFDDWSDFVIYKRKYK